MDMKLSAPSLVAKTALLAALLAASSGCDDGRLNVGGLCSTEADCPPGQICKDGACTSSCSTDSECQAAGLGVTCADGQCVGTLLPVIEAPETIGEGAEVQLDASKTVQIGAGDLAFAWEQTAGPAVTLAKADEVIATFVAPAVLESTTLSFQVTVSVGDDTATGTVSVTIENTVNEPPSAVLTGPTTPLEAGQTAELDATGSSDPNPADTLDWSWEPAAMITSKGSTATFTAPVVTELTEITVTVTVTDGEDEASDSITITVLPAATGCDRSCDDGNPCTEDGCDLDTGCTHTALDGGACDDGDACTIGDACKAGKCASAGALDCDDGNPCTTDGCSAATGCTHANNEGPCTDGNACSEGDHCQDGACVPGEADLCDDGNPCTTDSCDAGTCVHDPIAAGACSDGDACTTLDECQDGVCVGGPAPVCDDGEPCTDDACNSATGCTYTPNANPCDDGDPCTKDDACGEGTCLPGPLDEEKCGCSVDSDCAALEDGDYCNGTLYCDQSQPTPVCAVDPSSVVLCDASKDSLCEKKACDPASGVCLSTPIGDGTDCDDGNECTQGDVCSGGACKGVIVICDDGNPCTTDSCDAQLGCTSAVSTDACDDGNPCTTNDVCNNGACGGSPLICSDTNPCTKDQCDPEIGCTFLPTDAPCDDGNPCTAADVCSGGTCQGTTTTLCNDNNPCTDDGCDPGVGCVFANNANPCDDGSACTVGDACAGGKCVGTAPLSCDDGDPCTDDGCDEQGCTYVANTSPCDDGDICTEGDACADGACVPGATLACDDGNSCTQDACGAAGCSYTPLSGSCDDGNACTVIDTCVDGECLGDLPLDCNDGNPCTTDSCEPLVGCQHVQNTAACDDGNACTKGEACVGGACTGGGGVTCNDGNPCTTDTCDPQLGCVYANNSQACDDGNLCTGGDTCSGGECKGSFVTNCDDLNPCTTDTCVPQTGCKHANNANPCDDGSACTTQDVCSAGVCSGKTVSCDDANTCTTDSCDPLVGCVYAGAVGPCDDGNSCTSNDTCTNGKCAGEGQVCDDGNPCTDDGCDGTGGCAFTPNTKPCNDANACTTNDKCGGGACSGTVVLCNDGNPCTNDACNPAVGCTYTNNTVACSDGNACTGGDKCANGKCAGGPVITCNDDNPCTNDSCDPTTGCVYKNNTATCDDGNKCTTVDTCVAGKCVGSGTPVCADGNPCTDDACDPALGCVFSNNAAACNDGNACTTGDACSGGSCKGSPLSCNDGNPCTNDSCDPAKGCVYTPNQASCNDGDACTSGDKCTDGACTGVVVKCPAGGQCEQVWCDKVAGCQTGKLTGYCAETGKPCVGDGDCGDKDSCEPAKCDDNNACTDPDGCKEGICAGQAVSCDDGNPCTADTCDPKGGCSHTLLKDGSQCSDGDLCTTSDVCTNGVCAGVFKCDDGNLCTLDTCDAAGKCNNTPAVGSCNDGNACTTKDTCTQGQCVGTPVVCNDGNSCTADSCNSKTGCVYQNEPFGKACTNGSYGTCWSGSCQAWEIKTSTPASATGGLLYASHTPPGGALDAVGSTYNKSCSLLCFILHTPTVYSVAKSSLTVSPKSQGTALGLTYDAHGYLAVGPASGGTAVWSGTGWSFSGGPNFNVTGLSSPTFYGVHSLTSGAVTSHWLGGPYASGSAFLSLLRRCDRGAGGWGTCDIMPVLNDSSGTGCQQQYKFTTNGVWAGSATRVLFAGWTHDQIEGDPYGWPTVVTWNGNSFSSCGSLSGYKGEVYAANDIYATQWTKKPTGATFEAIGGSSLTNIWVGGKEGSVFAHEGTSWKQVNVAADLPAFNANFDVRGVLATDTDLHLVGDGMGVVSATCNDSFYLHATKASGVWKFDRLIKFSSNVYACGDGVTDAVRLNDIRFDAATGDLIVVGWMGDTTGNPTKSLPLVLRLPKPGTSIPAGGESEL
ncbi:MAG: hypothetical protein AMXMBFR64_23000 [Myxococcales bacterium]